MLQRYELQQVKAYSGVYLTLKPPKKNTSKHEKVNLLCCIKKKVTFAPKMNQGLDPS